MNTKAITCLLACLLLPACATRITNPPAPIEQQSAVEQFQVEDGKARVHFFLGELFMKGASGIKMNEVAELYINNVKIGLIGNDKEYMAIDLPPGTYALKWNPVSGGCRNEPLQITIKDKDLIFIKANMRNDTPSAAMLFGAIGTIAMLDIVSYLEPAPQMKNSLRAYTLVLLNKDFVRTVSIDTPEQNKPKVETEALSNTEKKLSDLKAMYEKDLITKEEYDAKRKELIGKY